MNYLITYKKIGIIIYLIMPFFAVNSIAQKSIPENYTLIYSQDFESEKAIGDFKFTDDNAWKIDDSNSGKSLHLHKQSNYKPKVRSPFNIAILQKVTVGDFILEITLNQTSREYNHRDLCLFFGIQNESQFYYTHIASVADKHANNIFLVDNNPRIKIASKTSKTINWGSKTSWHTERIERNTKEGTIKVFFDDMTHPKMEAKDTTLTYGKIGLGSFDDTGKFDNLKIWVPKTN
ncbi:hypothetical protein OD91_1268 [Lutibacter sp. Hel_I_33_5]|uniref:hypothetical protein n=1 Tax=Lutibacter sp. Hel_I_33_5 TaxID=1566289 RepID=UPI0011ACC7F3|nr:hypothetical protein [Lutibacter sp. Hel_I_33_5]TVZ55991.1 hypothetical protein OD91_1268 [Lutibacter sp. Hel_I_33_5]